MHSPECSGRDRAEFEAWLRAAPAHWRAYAEAERVSRRFDQLIECDTTLSAMADAAAGSSHETPGRRWKVPAAIAASLMLGLFALRFIDHQLETGPAALESFANRSDRGRTITLADASVLHLDVGSEVTVSMSKATRDITLTRGRALFEVAKDSNRPFVVTAGATRTKALGTVFQVQRESQRVVVVLTEGSVAVHPTSETQTWETRLAPGEQFSLSGAGASPIKHRVDSLMATSWSRGRLIFRGTPLAEALEEVNRYSARKVRMADPGLADLLVAGNFIAGDSELIVSALVAALPIRCVEGGGGEILLFRRYEIDPPN